ncbi:hypothetical protein CBR_g8413 [Chara braunii]|uniref:DNA-directed DNA polymerase n=1 Tax=Chara braunii TaxID=69332 RepID=A0A388KM49_CHABU|nr:hypothetical protein CBR_g8413 [Chara braunii]|eukprot:GBG71115.1 hypothetical protein CBR_g8413 [Chara braunii]
MRVCLSGGGGGSAAATAAVGMPSAAAASLSTADVGFGRGSGVDREHGERRYADTVCDRQSRAAMSVAGWAPPQRVSRFLPAGGNLHAAAAADFASATGAAAGVSDDRPRSSWSSAAFRGDLCHWLLAAPPRGISGGGGGGGVALRTTPSFSRRRKLHDCAGLRARCRLSPGNGHADHYSLAAARAYGDTPSPDAEHDVGSQFTPVVCDTPFDRESVNDAEEHPTGAERTSRQGLDWPGEQAERALTVNVAWLSGMQHGILHGDEWPAKREVAWEEEQQRFTVEEEASAAVAATPMSRREVGEEERQGVWNRSFNQKYRPRKLRELVGQARVAEALSSALALERIAPAYIFSGPRGTGKTSAARIFAAALNCLEDLSSNSDGVGDRRRRGREPCGQCSQCISTLRGTNVDVREIDAATHNGVESIRELLSSVRLSPVCSSVKYKVYVIDECHMLSSEAANALLKTLEEAPAMAVFILVTTDPQRLPPTVLSRCLRFPFHRIGVQDMVSRLADVARREGVAVQPDALRLMAAYADGALRDGETILEQMSLLQGACSSARGGGEVTTAMVREFLGVVGEEEVCELLTSVALADQFPEISLARIRNMTETRAEPAAIVSQLAALITDLLASRCEAAAAVGGGGDPQSSHAQALHGAKGAEEVAGHGGQLKGGLIELARTPDGLVLLRQMLGKLAEVEKQLRAAGNPQLWLEVGLLSLAESKISQNARDLLIPLSTFSCDRMLPPTGPLSMGTAIAGATLCEGGSSAEGAGEVIATADDYASRSAKVQDEYGDAIRTGRAAKAGSLLSEVALPAPKAEEAVESSASPSLSSSPTSPSSPSLSSSSRGELSSSVSSAERRERGAASLEMGKRGRLGASKAMDDEDPDVDVQERSRTVSFSSAEKVVVSRPAVRKKGSGDEMYGDSPRARDGAIGEDALRRLTGGSEPSGENEDGERDGRRSRRGGLRSGGMEEVADEVITAVSQAREEGDNIQETVRALPLDKLWEDVIGKVKLKTVRMLLENRGRLESFSQDGAFVLFTVSEFAKRAEKNKHHIEAAFKKVCGSEVTVTINNVAGHSGSGNEFGGRRGIDASAKKQVRKARGSFEESESPVPRGVGAELGGDGVEMAISEGMKLRRGRRPLAARKDGKQGSRKGDEELGMIESPSASGGNDLCEKDHQLADGSVSSMGRGARQPDETVKVEEECTGPSTRIANCKDSDRLNLMIRKRIAGEAGSSMTRTQEEMEADYASEWEKETAKYTIGSGHRDGSEGPWQVSSIVSSYEGEVEWEADTEISMEYLMPGSQEDGEGGIGVLGSVNTANMVLRKNRDEQSDSYEGKTGSALVIERVRRNRNEKKKPLLPRKLEAAESIAKVFNGIVIPF